MLTASILRHLDQYEDLAVVRDGAKTIIAIDALEKRHVSGPQALDALGSLTSGWWAGAIAYELGREIEQIETPRSASNLPDLLLTRFGARMVLAPNSAPTIEGEGSGVLRLRRALDAACPGIGDTHLVGVWSSSLSRQEFEAGVEAIIELERAGECYQVNLTRRLTCDAKANDVDLFDALDRNNPSPHAALIRTGDISIVSASPERFLSIEGRRVETRPIKGTARDAADLLESAKDRAENIMIVDLARNDLGRVCTFGSVSVPVLCALEPHPGLHHLVSTVTGTLAPGIDLAQLLRATLPPASVTGAPKPRVLSAIEEFEPVPRGYYCGAVGWIDTANNRADLAVAIRTFTIASGETTLGVGAGITVGSNPQDEWDETELKAARLLSSSVGTSRRSRVRTDSIQAD